MFADPLSVTISDPSHSMLDEVRFATMDVSHRQRVLVAVHLMLTRALAFRESANADSLEARVRFACRCVPRGARRRRLTRQKALRIMYIRDHGWVSSNCGMVVANLVLR